MPSHDDDDSGVNYLKNHYHIGISGQENARLNGRWARDNGQAQSQSNYFQSLMGLANCAGVQRSNPVESMPAPIQHESAIDYAEESRKETEQDMLLHPRQRRFMERVMPIEWCRARYPKVYEQR